MSAGNSIAINGLGYMHMYGMGVAQSFAEAMKLFSRAAEQVQHPVASSRDDSFL